MLPLARKPSAREAPKGGTSSLSKLALLKGSMVGELWEGRMRLAEGGISLLVRSANL